MTDAPAFLSARRIRQQVAVELASGTRRFWDLAARIDRPLVELLDELGTWIERGWIRPDGDRCALTEAGRHGLRELPPRSGLVAVADVVDSRADAPLPVIEYFQGAVTPEDVVRRVDWMHGLGDVWGRRVLLLGDDDYVGLALAATGLPERVAVLDIDERVLAHGEAVGRRRGWPVEHLRHDLSRPLPSPLRGAFDVVLTDPPETPLALELVLSRAASALGRDGALYLSLSRIEATAATWHSVQRQLVTMGLGVTHVRERANAYPDAPNEGEAFYGRLRLVARARQMGFRLPAPDIVWYRKDVVRAEVVSGPLPTREDGVELTSEFYDGEAILATFEPEPPEGGPGAEG